MSGNAENKNDNLSDLPDINFMYKTMLARDPSKRRVKPTPTVELFPLTLESESEDSDFKLEDDEIDGDDSDSASVSSSSSDTSDTEKEETEENPEQIKEKNGLPTVPEVCKPVTSNQFNPTTFQLPPGVPEVRVCCICLGTHSSDLNEVVECDSCGILVHEGCYGVIESNSVSSTASTCSTEPWFCEPCQGNVVTPACQLCPNLGGALKETDTGLWVHLVCALYVPGIAFGELDKLTQVTLFEMPYNRWGAKSCALCSDPWLSRTGVCIGCDAGMCRTFFHVTCAQREGLLSETFHEDTVQADPFYANCKLHTEKSTMRRRKSNYFSHQRHLRWWTCKRNAGHDQMNTGPGEEVSLRRILRKLDRQRVKFNTKHWPRATWIPTQKMPRLLTTSASAVRRLRQKAVLMDVDVEAEEARESQLNALADLPRKWHIAPAFSVEYTAYVIDRERRISHLRTQTETLKEETHELSESEKQWRLRYERLIEEQTVMKNQENAYRSQLSTLHQILSAISPKRTSIPVVNPRAQFNEEPTALNRRMSRSPPPKIARFNRNSVESASLPDNSNHSSRDFWVADIQAGPSNRLLHVNPEGSNGDSSIASPKMVLKRVIKSSAPQFSKKLKKAKVHPVFAVSIAPNRECVDLDSTPVGIKNGKCSKLKIKIKPILPKVAQSGFPFVFANSDSEQPQRVGSPSSTRAETESVSSVVDSTMSTPKMKIICFICSLNGLKSTTVSCDECQRVFHLGCLDPPVKKTPKQRGYSWHCADCDPSGRSE